MTSTLLELRKQKSDELEITVKLVVPKPKKSVNWVLFLAPSFNLKIAL